MIVDPKLTFSGHIDKLVKKSRQRIGAIAQVRKFIDKNIALTLYKALVCPLFDFNDIVFMQTSQDMLSRLEVLQNNACRLILRCPKPTRVSDMLHSLKLQSLYYHRDMYINLFMFNILYGYILDEQIIRLFVYLEDTRPHQTRAITGHDLVVNKRRTLFGSISMLAF